MGKMMSALLLIFAIEMALFLFVSGDTADSTSLFSFLLNPNISSAPFYIYLTSAISGVGLALIVVGSFFTKTEFIWRAGVVTVFTSFSGVLIRLWQFIEKEGAMFGGIGTSGVSTSAVIATIIVGPLLIFFLMAAVDFISAKD